MVYEAGTRFGFMPGSQAAGSRLYGPQYQGVYGAIAPVDKLKDAQAAATYGGEQRAQERFGLFKDLFGQFGKNWNSSINSSTTGFNVPAPNYLTPSPVWSQNQINSMANSQGAQMQAQAANATRGYANAAAARGFSPMSPMTQFMQQVNGQRANIGAAQNATKLNFDAALGNANNMNAQSGINANLYGSYTGALGQARGQQLQAQNQGTTNQLEMLNLISRLLGGA